VHGSAKGTAGTAVLFATTSGAGEAQLGGPASVVVIAGLEPGKRYRVIAAPSGGCSIKLEKATGNESSLAGPGGFVRVETPGCGG
jgi:hypothetical protein